jgi:NAD(P)-dependent dehydrogenase (short-subunit alcohol dehydrogenase family)
MNLDEEAKYMARVTVTGGSGKVGRACVEELLQHGYEVFNIDVARPAKERCRFTRSISPTLARRSKPCLRSMPSTAGLMP